MSEVKILKKQLNKDMNRLNMKMRPSEIKKLFDRIQDLEGQAAEAQKILNEIEERLKQKSWLHYAISDYIVLRKRHVNIPRCDKYSEYALQLPAIWLDDAKEEFKPLRVALGEKQKSEETA